MKKWIPLMATLLIAGVWFTWTARSNDDDKRRDGDRDKPREGQRSKPREGDRERDRERPGDQRERDDLKTEREKGHKIRQFIEQAERKISELRKHEEAGKLLRHLKAEMATSTAKMMTA